MFQRVMGVEKGEKEGWGLNSLSQVRPPTGLIILDCLFSIFCCHGDGAKRDCAQIYALCSLMPCPRVPAASLPTECVCARAGD